MDRFQTICFSLVVLLAAEIAFGQEIPLGDVARQQRDKQKSKPANRVSKVLTNEDLPKHPDSETDAATQEDVKDEEIGDQSSAKSSRLPERQSAGHWQAQILIQKRSIAAQQKQLERLRASIHFVDANRYVNGAQYNEQQRRRQLQLEQAEKQLEQQKKRLADMQDRARRAGFGNSVYDPND
jgi:hypothetical protein